LWDTVVVKIYGQRTHPPDMGFVDS
jgi:hypothetical protein